MNARRIPSPTFTAFSELLNRLKMFRALHRQELDNRPLCKLLMYLTSLIHLNLYFSSH